MTQTATPPSTATPERKNPLANLDWRRYVIYIGFAVVFLFFAITLGDDGFLTGNNLLNIVRQTATVTIIAVGMTYVIAAAQIDLSVGATAGLASVVTAMTIANYGVFLGILAGLAVGVVVGSVNGALVAMLKIPSFLVTLGMLGIAAGVAQWITKSAPQPILSDLYNKVFGSGDIGPIPGLIVWMSIVVVIGAIVLAKTRFGRQVLATGGNPIAAKFTGINTTSITFRVLLISASVGRAGGHALRRAAPVRPLPVGHRRRTVRDRRGDPRRHQPFRRQRHRRRNPVRRPADRVDQQRADPRRSGHQPATGRPRSDHHPRRRPRQTKIACLPAT